MVAQSNGHAPVELAELPAAGSNAQTCPRPRTREESPSVTATARDLPAAREPVAERLRRAMRGDTSIWHSRRASVAGAWERHKLAAGHFAAPIARWLRMGWGCGVHMPVKTLLCDPLDWVTESPGRCIVAGLLITAAWYWR